MNIDIRKFENDYTPDHDETSIMQLITECEIKPIDCNNCLYYDEEPVKHCLNCIHDDHIDNFKQKQNELDNLFIGAPVILNGNKYNDIRINYYDGVSKANIYRLPTVNEAPRNVWLAPWIKIPKELKKLRTLIRYENDKLIAESNYGWDKVKWKNITAIMILEDFKR